jgi:LmbE family N-acetylglucosaminyl deacetylase
MQLFRNVPSRQLSALFLFAHQDDEFGVFQKIIDEQRNGRRVLCAYLTDGAFERQSSIRRNRESLAVLKKLGVKEEDIFFAGHELSIPDGSLPDHLKTASDWIANWLNCYPKVTAIYLPAWEGGHHDHDALHAMGVIVAEEAGLIKVVRQFPLYNGYKCGGPLFRVLLPLPMNGDIERKKIPWINRLQFLRYCLSYPSQMTTWLGLFPFAFLHYVFYGTQLLQTVSRERIGCRPHSGSLYYERRGFSTWEKMSNTLAGWIAHRRNLKLF